MVVITGGKSKSAKAEIANELVGLTEPTPYIAALFSFVAKQGKKEEADKVHQAKKTVGGYTRLSERVKAMSLFPSVYDKPVRG